MLFRSPLISALSEGIVKIRKGKTEDFFEVKSGVVEVLDNKVLVLAE